MPHYFRPIMFNILRIRASTAGQLSLIVFRAPGLPCSRALRHFSDISQFDRLFNMKPILTADDIESEFDEDNDFEGMLSQNYHFP
jgi:hypothetical protein